MNRDPSSWARLGKALQQARLSQRLSQDQLAERADVSASSVQNAEAGKVPKGRMPYTVPAIATALGWPTGAIDAVLEGAEPPGGWEDIPVQPLIDAERLETTLAGAMVRAIEGASSAEIKKAVRIALDELRRQGLV